MIDYFTCGASLADLAESEGLTQQRVFWLINSALERYRKAAQQYNFLDIRKRMEELSIKAKKYDFYVGERTLDLVRLARKMQAPVREHSSLEELGIDKGLKNMLVDAGIFSLEQLCAITPRELKERMSRGFGPGKLGIIQDRLKQLGLSLLKEELVL